MDYRIVEICCDSGELHTHSLQHHLLGRFRSAMVSKHSSPKQSQLQTHTSRDHLLQLKRTRYNSCRPKSMPNHKSHLRRVTSARSHM
ncbi:hypothetical protein CEXT_467451 [Caerostris extrusa]|uniref:Uncharacterized protein n=1 Tax=Caerostris extrusa TaxID=172846 RepID=A0AAV4NZH4_CAEEX|nr:hypothetical protein CEXT_467451 [Caerostris extrusa]